ncbi:hypothetical protein F4824DRAFT_140850 [Ustulina deusta]|nr:hypothetical protein F4824DRAFT_140850 [Ustulina deusta]
MEDKGHLHTTYLGACKFRATLLPSRTQPNNTEYSFISPGLTSRSKSYSAPPVNGRDNNSKRQGHQDSTSSPAHQRDVLSRTSHCRERNGHIEGSQCQVGDCYRHQLRGTAYCGSHICRTASCGEIRALGSQHCLGHKCRACSAEAEAGSSSCGAHKCRVGSCVRGKAAGQAWCKQHGCRWRGCAEAAARGARYCRDHACAAGACGLRVLRIGSLLGNYCCCHSCCAEACLLRASSTGAFCADHGCRARGFCPNPRLWDDECGPGREHECCRFHTCVQRGCFAPTAQIGALCGRHSAGNNACVASEHEGRGLSERRCGIVAGS